MYGLGPTAFEEMQSVWLARGVLDHLSDGLLPVTGARSQGMLKAETLLIIEACNNVIGFMPGLGWFRERISLGLAFTLFVSCNTILPSSVHNQEILGSVHNHEKSHFKLNARLVLDVARLRPVQARITL